MGSTLLSRLVFLLFPVICFAQPSGLRLEGSTSTQAVVSYIPSSSTDCTHAVVDAAGNALNATNATLFAGINSDATRKIEDPATRRRWFVIGLRKAEASGGRMYSKALPADSDLRDTVACDGSAVTLAFRTAPIGGIAPDSLPFDAAAHGNFAVPDFDWSDLAKPIILPQSGAKVWALDNGKRVAHQRDRAFTRYLAPGWTSPANLLADSTATTASVGTTAVAAVFFLATPSENVMGGYNPANSGEAGYTLNDLRVRVSGYASSATDADRRVNIYRSLDACQTQYKSAITVTLPLGSGAVSTQSIPSGFPQPGFLGWGGGPIPREHLPHYGTASLSGSTLTIGAPPTGDIYSVRTFKPEWAAGTKIYLAGSSGFCTNSLCTIASISSPTVLTISESGTLSNVAWESNIASVCAAKVNGNGTINLSLGYRVSASINQSQPEEESCSSIIQPVSVNKAGGALATPVDGYICTTRDYLRLAQRLLWISNADPGDNRLLSLFRIPTAISGHAAGDLPDGGGFGITYGNAVFDSNDPKVMYLTLNTPNGRAFFRTTYTCNFGEIGTYLMGSSGNIDSADNCLTWENTSRGGSSLTAQAAGWPAYAANSTFWGATPTLDLVGMIQGRAVFSSYSMTKDYAAWIFSFNLSTGAPVLERAFNTLNGPGMSFAGLHSTVASNVLTMVLHATDKNSGVATGGEFRRLLTHVKKAGAWATNTSLPWPGDSTYDRACPSGLSTYFTNRGATGNNCAQIRIQYEPCSSFSTLAERTAHPCPSDSSKSWMGRALAPGDVIWDSKGCNNVNCATDSETMMIVKREDPSTPSDPSDDTITVLRDQKTGYGCSNTVPRGRVCTGDDASFQHADQWTLTGRMLSVEVTWDPITGEFLDIPGDAIRGHSDFTARPGGNHSMVAVATDSVFNLLYFGQVDQPRVAYGTKAGGIYMKHTPMFARQAEDVIGVQSYAAPPINCTLGPIWCSIGSDWNHLNSGNGSSAEVPDQGIGTIRTVTNVTGNVFKATAISGATSKSREPWLTIGPYVLQDMSSAATGDVITNGNTGKFCIPRLINECRTGSTVGEIYWVMAGTSTTDSYCWGSSASKRVPCAWSTSGIHGNMRQMRFANDPAGMQQRVIGLLTCPQMQYVYAKNRTWPGGRRMLSTAFNLEGNYTLPVLIDPGGWANDTANRATFIPVKVEAGVNLVVEFGYEENGPRESFFCTSRLEKCVAKAIAINESNPFQYAGESGAYNAVSAVVPIPALPGRMLYYRVIAGGVAGPLQVKAVN